MKKTFAETIRYLRNEQKLSQAQLAEQLFVTRSTIARWECGDRLPDAIMITRLAKCLGVSIDSLFTVLSEQDKNPVIILVDDERIILTGSLPVLEEVFPNAIISGFTNPLEAILYAHHNRIALAFLDIEMGKKSGLELCRELQEINPRTEVFFLTAYMDYSLSAWKTGAAGFIVKPITADEIRRQLPRLKYPLV